MTNSSTLALMDTIKQSFYGYGYSIYSIQEGGLEKEFDLLKSKGFVELNRNATTDKTTSVHPTELGLRVGMTIDEKKKLQKLTSNGIWVIVSGVAITIIGGLVLHYGFGIGASTN
ncbi:MAG: hypothetical protein WAO28_03335 [Candidatus Microsaccharimonas sp.]